MTGQNVMAKSAAATLENYKLDIEFVPRNDNIKTANGQQAAYEITKKLALKQLHDEVIEGLPEKIDMSTVPYQKDRQPQMYVAGYNQALDDVTKFIDSYFERQE